MRSILTLQSFPGEVSGGYCPEGGGGYEVTDVANLLELAEREVGLKIHGMAFPGQAATRKACPTPRLDSVYLVSLDRAIHGLDERVNLPKPCRRRYHRSRVGCQEIRVGSNTDWR